MKFLNRHKAIIIITLICAVFLAVAYFSASEPAVKVTEAPVSQATYAVEKIVTEAENPVSATATHIPATAVPESTAVPTEQKAHCTLSVRCDTILVNMDRMDPVKVGIVPRDGVIYARQTVEINDGDSAFSVLEREMRKNGIHLEFVNVPAYGSSYIEGIANIYEFDCGELSGWMYKVNGQYPGYGSSNFILSDGDEIEWIYTCDLGSDVGGRRGQ